MKVPGREVQAVDTNGGKIREGWSAADCDRYETASRMDWMWNSGRLYSGLHIKNALGSGDERFRYCASECIRDGLHQ